MDNQHKDEVQILAVSIDRPEDSKKLRQKLRERSPDAYDFPFLEDKDHRVIDRYGILNADGNGWPHPATYIIGLQGIVRWKFIEINYRKRATNEQIRRELVKIR